MIAALWVLGSVGAQLWASTSASRPQSQSMTRADGLLSFGVQNRYTQRDGQPGKDYPWVSTLQVVAEPYVQSTLVVRGAAQPEHDYYYEWQLGAESYVGVQVNITFEELGRQALTLLERDAVSSNITREVHAKVWVKFVRRELRTLFREDLMRYMDALETVYRVKELEGRTLYGKAYRDLGFFLRTHQVMASSRTCDHFHDGLGFLNHHSALSLLMDRVIHMVDREAPAIPYWDHTIDAVDVDAAKDMNVFFNSAVFDDQLFGAFPSEIGDHPDMHQITRGRFANISMSAKYWGARYSPNLNGYGLLRSPWNLSPAPFITRSRRHFNNVATFLPGCPIHYSLLNDGSDFAFFGVNIQSTPHGPMHSTIGGAWGKDYTELLGAHMEEKVLRHFAVHAFGYVKALWRFGYMECPSSCEASSDSQQYAAGEVPSGDEQRSCACSCPDLDRWIATNETHVVLGHIRVSREAQQSPSGEDIGPLLLQVLCNTDGNAAQIGDSATSSAAADPTFWLLHPTTERLLQWKRLNGLNMEWPEKNDLQIPGVCWGHGGNDTTIWKDLFDDEDGHYYTNLELLLALDPTSPHKMDYIFDTFEWPHCATNYGYPLQLIESI